MDPEAKPTPGYLTRSLCTKLLSLREEENHGNGVILEPIFQSHQFECYSQVVPIASEKSTMPSLKRSL